MTSVLTRLLSWLLLVITVLLFPLSMLTTLQSPVGTNWTRAVIAGEFGHWFAPVALVVAALAWWRRKSAPRLGPATAMLGLLTTVLFLKPTFQAWRIGRRLPGELSAQFGAAHIDRSPLALTTLFTGRTAAEPVPMQTFQRAPDLPLDFYPPVSARDTAAPCVIIVHGGGWHTGDRTELADFDWWLARRGYAVAAISYRLVPRALWPAQREDVLAAIAYLKTHAAELRIDPTRLVLLGRSAGGQIVQAVGYTARDPALRGVIAYYGPSDLVFGYVNTHENDMIKSPRLMRAFLGGTPDTARDNYVSASALNFVTKDSPPTLLLHGANDPLVWHRHSVRLHARLQELGVPCVFVSLPWATHAFDYNAHGPGGQLAAYAIEWFLARVTK